MRLQNQMVELTSIYFTLNSLNNSISNQTLRLNNDSSIEAQVKTSKQQTKMIIRNAEYFHVGKVLVAICDSRTLKY